METDSNVCVCEQKHAFGQEGHGVERSLHVLVGDPVQRPPPPAAAGPRKPPECPHLLLITHTKHKSYTVHTQIHSVFRPQSFFLLCIRAEE